MDTPAHSPMRRPLQNPRAGVKVPATSTAIVHIQHMAHRSSVRNSTLLTNIGGKSPARTIAQRPTRRP